MISSEVFRPVDSELPSLLGIEQLGGSERSGG
jgi:hypothetical protein